MASRQEIVAYACQLTGLPDFQIMDSAIEETFGKEDLPIYVVDEMIQVIAQIYETNEVKRILAQ